MAAALELSRKVILASGSPRRRELLSDMGIDFTVDTGNTFTEVYDAGTPAGEVPIVLSKGKSHGFHRPLAEDEVLVTADTVVIDPVDNSILGKPHSRAEAQDMLRRLSGCSHKVVTGVTVRTTTEEKSIADETLVTFRELSESEIDYYIDEYKPFDKAGAYGIQEWIGLAAISSIQGSFYNVMGLPTHRLYEMLTEYSRQR